MPRTPPPRRGAERARNLLLIVAGFVAMLGIIAGGSFLYLYDRATAIDRSTPRVVADQFLAASLVERDSRRVSLFVCSTWSSEEALEVASPPIATTDAVVWGDFEIAVDDDQATVGVNVQFSANVGGSAQRLSQHWVLSLVEQEGWHVCSLTKEPSLS